MHNTSETAGYADYRLFERDTIEARDIPMLPSPARLRTACLMIYAGLLLTLGAMLSSAQASAQVSVQTSVQTSAPTSTPGDWRRVPEAGSGTVINIPICAGL